MRPVLVLALGNTLAGDDAIAYDVIASCAADPELAAAADFVEAGTDLFRMAPALLHRSRIILVDAALAADPDPRVEVLPHPPTDRDGQVSAHALDPVAALDLLRSLEPDIARADIRWILVDVPDIAVREGLSRNVAALIPLASGRLRELILATG